MSIPEAIKQQLRTKIRANPRLYRSINRLRGLRLHDAEAVASYAVLGSEYGGWATILASIDRNSVIYSVGVGEDITYDVALIAEKNCVIHAFDPTPIAVDWIKSRQVPENFRFHQVGLGATDGVVAFEIPPIAGWHSYSLTPEPGAQQRGTVSCSINRLSTIMRNLGHDRIDLLKMDIEGFEYQVLDDMIKSSIRPHQLLVEFHHGLYTHTKRDTRDAVEKVRSYGYQPYWVSDVGREYAFVLRK